MSSVVKKNLSLNLMPASHVVASDIFKCQRPRKADVGSGRVSEPNANTRTFCSNRVTSTLNELSDKPLRAVWEAAQRPLDCQDPLDRGFSEDEQAKLTVLFPGLHEFLEHRQRWHSASGRLFPGSDDNAREQRNGADAV